MSPPSPLGAHYRTPLGAFYRTPLGAFGLGEAAPTGDWVVEAVDTIDNDGGGLTDACAFGNEGIPYYQTRIDPQDGNPFNKVISQGTVTFTGDISGAVWTWVGPATCVSAIFGVGDAKPLVAPARTFKPWQMWIYDVDFNFYQGFAITLDAPGASGFQLGETVTVS